MAETEAQVEEAGGASAFGSSEFESLLQKEFRPKSDQAKTAVESAVKTLAEQALAERAKVAEPRMLVEPAVAESAE